MLIIASLSTAALPPDAKAAALPPDAKAACAALNFSSKVELMHGFGEIAGYSRNSGCGYYCGRKTFRWDNGPQGFGDDSPAGNSTQWPSTLNIAATFDPELAHEFGVAMGEEWWGKGTNFLEGPGINVMRVPYNGRTFEYISGEDPVLGSMLVGPAIDGMQQNAMAIAKHYILNNQETDRSGVNSLVDEKTIMELYAPPFATAAAHNVAGYMCAYNRINGEWACEQPATLRTMLKGHFNFSGFVVSDWGACHSTVAALNAGLDIEMPSQKFFNEKSLQTALNAKQITMARIDESCERILSRYYALPPAKRYPCDGGVCIDRNVSTAAHKALARRISAQSTVLLKNAPPTAAGGKAAPAAGDKAAPAADEAPLLPLPRDRPLKIALIGPDAEHPYTAGGGSGHVANSNVAVTPLAAFRARANVQVTYASGCTGGKPDVAGAAAVAAAADVSIVFVSAQTGEGHDRKSLNLSKVVCAFAPPPAGTPPSEAHLGYAQELLINAVAATQQKTVVVMAVPGPTETDWRGSVSAILCAFLPGEQYGAAMVDLIFGDVVPQARLPVSMPRTANDQGMTTHQWPGVPSQDFPGHLESNYSEGQINGYRWYDKHSASPAFAFGFGLTYGSFTYADLHVSGRNVTFTVTRDDDDAYASDAIASAGCDTPQLYLSYPRAKSDPRTPLKVLRYFQKTCARITHVSYVLTDRDVSEWDVPNQAWAVTRGTYEVAVMHAAQGGGPALTATLVV